MTLALVSFEAYGQEADEPLTKRFVQRMQMTITGANTDAIWDFGNYTGTFWTAVGATDPGKTCLLAMKDIQLRAQSFLGITGNGLTGQVVLPTAGGVTSYTSAAGGGGAATQVFTVTGLAAGDTIISVVQKTKGANNLPLLGYTTQAANALTGVYSADPGAGAVIVVTVQKAASVPSAGYYTVTLDATNGNLPDLVFASGSAPTAANIVLRWEFFNGYDPVKVKKP